MTDVAHEVMLHDILPLARCKVYDKSVDTWAIGKHKLFYPWADVALRLCPHDNIKPLCNITCVYQLPMYQQLLYTIPCKWSYINSDKQLEGHILA